jgi:membrane protease YdiL (CAAX protease family)
MDAGRIGIRAFSACLLAVVVHETLLLPWLLRVMDDRYAALGLVRVSEALTLAFLGVRLEGRLSLGFPPGALANGMARGMLWSALFGLGAGLAGALLWLCGFSPLNMLGKGALSLHGRDLVFFLAAGCIAAPVAEEIFFRGVVFAYFRAWGLFPALALSTALFAGAHWLTDGVPVTQTIGGFFFALCYEREKNLAAPIVFHAAGNAAIYALVLTGAYWR